jgi:signal transduction histidine kinase
MSMMGLRGNSIKRKLMSMSVLSSGVGLLLACATFLVYDFVTFRETMARVLSTQADIVGYNSISPLVFQDGEAAEETLSALTAEPNVIAAAVYDKQGRLFATYTREGLPDAFEGPRALSSHQDSQQFTQRHLTVFRGITFRGEQIGTVFIQSDLHELFARLQKIIGIGLIVLVLSILAALLIAFRLQRSFSRPISGLAEAATRISQEKDYSVRVPPSGSRDELGLLIEAFNEMLSQIQQRDAALLRAHQEVELKVTERTQELEAINKELESFTYSVSHDLRAPLRRIDGFAQLLIEDYYSALPEDAQRYLSRVRDGTRQMGCLVDDLLNLARIGRKEINRQVTGLDSVLSEVVSEQKRELDNRNIEWRLQPLPFADCDPALLNVVMTNLISNAVKYTRPRERAVIEVGAFEQNGNSVIYVRDNGVGFSMKYADKLFGVFQRLHRVEDFEGTGVGLATVQRIIHKHGGKIWVEAELDKGACFYFTLAPPGDDEPAFVEEPEKEAHGARAG